MKICSKIDSKTSRLFTIGLFVIGFVLLASSCAPAPVIMDEGSSGPTVPGVVTDLAIDEASTESTSLIVQWSAPMVTGTKPDGSALAPGEISYRIYYLAGTVDEEKPSAESIKDNPDTSTQEVTEALQASIAELEPETRYFIMVVSYNSLEPELETVLGEVIAAMTSEDIVSLEGILNYRQRMYVFSKGIGGTITPIATPSIPDTDTSNVRVRYGLTRSTGTKFTPVPTIAGDGIITVDRATNEGTATYVIQAFATGYDDIINKVLTIIVKNDSTAPGAVTSLDIVDASVGSTSFGVRWTAPEGTGTKADGTELGQDEIGYRIYYLARSTDQTEAITAEFIRQNEDSQKQDLGEGVTSTTITDLIPVTRYFVTVVSYNSLEEQQLEKTPDEAVDVVTGDDSTAPGAVTGISIDDTSVDSTSFLVQWSAPAEAGTRSDGTALTPEEIGYHVYYLAGTTTDQATPTAELLRQDSEALTLEVTGVTETRITGLEMTTRYFVTIVSYNTFTPELEARSDEVGEANTISSQSNFGGTLAYEQEEHEFTVGLDDSIRPDTTPTIPSTDVSGATIRYSLERRDGTVFVPDLAIAEDTGVITIDSITNAGTARYFVRAEATGYTTQNVTLTITVVKADFVGDLAYMPTTNEFVLGLGGSITPTGTPTIPDTDSSGASISYSIERMDGTEIGSDLTIDSYGVITIDPATNLGTARYTVQATADGYNTQEATLEIAIKDYSTAPGAVTGISIDEASVDSDSFVLRWTAPADKGTNADGTALNSDEIVYRVYSLEGVLGQTMPSAESIKSDAETQTQELTGVLQASITELNPETRYFIAVESYNSFAALETISDEVIEVNTKAVLIDFDGTLRYRSPSYSFFVGLSDAITSDSTPSIPGSLVGTIEYSITRITGTVFVPEPSINDRGIITIGEISNEGTATYVVKAAAEGFVEQTVSLDIRVSKANLDGILRYRLPSYSFFVGLSDSITPDNIPSIPSFRDSAIAIAYSLTRSGGTVFVPEPAINEDSGVITINSISNEGTATYVVKAAADGYVERTVELDISVSKESLDGALSYEPTSYSFFVGLSDSITPDNIPSIPASRVGTIAYSLTRSGGTVFVPEPAINENDGVITIGEISNEGTATYTVTASAEDLAEQIVSLSISVSKESFDGTLSYEPTSYSFFVGLSDSITPDNIPSIPDSRVGTIAIAYSITRSGEPVFDPEPSINEDSGVITINPINSTGTATYVVRAVADDFAEQTVELDISISERALQVSAYYSEEAEVIPIGLGRSVASGTGVLEESDVIFTIAGLKNESHTIHFGTGVDSYSESFQRVVSDGSVSLLKSDLATNSFSLTDGAVIGISGSGIIDTKHIATYRPSNIYIYQELQAMKEDLDQAYVLGKNIVFAPMTDATGTTISNYEAVGDDDAPFTGSLDGAGYSITGIEIVSIDNYQGLFGVMEASTVDKVIAQNLVLRDFKLTGNAVVGSLAGWVKQGTVDNVHVEVSNADAGKVEIAGFGGGLLGRAGETSGGTQARIQNTSSATTVVGTGLDQSRIGGLVGDVSMGSMLTESYTTGSVTGNDDVGGLVGHNDGGTVSGSSIGSVTGNDYVGGLVGHNESGTVSGSSTGSISGNDYVGGLVGRNSDTVTGYMTGSVVGNSRTGGLVGQNSDTVTGYATGSVAGDNEIGGLVGFNEGTVRGYMTGSAAGNDYLGGLVGTSAGTVSGYMTGIVIGSGVSGGGLVGLVSGGTVTGYARGVVRRGGGTSTAFGKVFGAALGTHMTYSSSKSQIYDGETGTVELTGATGIDGTAVTVDSSADSPTMESVFSEFTFGTALGQWTWVADGKWPAINIGVVKLASDQPVDP